MSYLDRRHFRLLIALSQHPSLSAAARAMAITQSAASQQLREAERRLGVVLVQRVGRHLALSQAGRRLLEGALLSERALSAAESDALWITRGEGQRLRILQSLYDDPGWIAALSGHLLELQPPVPVELIRSSPAQFANALAAGQADLGLFPGTHEFSGLRSYASFSDSLVALLAPQDPLGQLPVLQAGDLRQRRYITYGLLPESGFEYEGFFLPGGGMPKSILRVESTSAIVELVAAGQGVSVLSHWAVRAAEQAGRIITRRLLPAPPPLRWSLMGRPLAQGDILAAVFQELAAWLPGWFSDTATAYATAPAPRRDQPPCRE